MIGIIFSLMVYILSGLASYKASINRKMRGVAVLRKDKRQCARMLRDVLVCCKLVSR